MKKAYLANGLFGLGDRLLNEFIALGLRGRMKDNLELFVPQEQPFNDKSSYADSITIAKSDTKALLESDFMIAVIDGVEIDSGVAAEIGIFSTTGKPIYALYSDVRQHGRDNDKKIEALIREGEENQFMYRNLFVVGLIKQTPGGIYSDFEEFLNTIDKKENT